MSIYDEIPDTDQMEREALERYLIRLQEELEILDRQEPENMACEAYETWGDKHEILEDLIEETQECLDALEAQET